MSLADQYAAPTAEAAKQVIWAIVAEDSDLVSHFAADFASLPSFAQRSLAKAVIIESDPELGKHSTRHLKKFSGFHVLELRGGIGPSHARAFFSEHNGVRVLHRAFRGAHGCRSDNGRFAQLAEHDLKELVPDELRQETIPIRFELIGKGQTRSVRIVELDWDTMAPNTAPVVAETPAEIIELVMPEATPEPRWEPSGELLNLYEAWEESVTTCSFWSAQQEIAEDDRKAKEQLRQELPKHETEPRERETSFDRRFMLAMNAKLRKDFNRGGIPMTFRNLHPSEVDRERLNFVAIDREISERLRHAKKQVLAARKEEHRLLLELGEQVITEDAPCVSELAFLLTNLPNDKSMKTRRENGVELAGKVFITAFEQGTTFEQQPLDHFPLPDHADRARLRRFLDKARAMNSGPGIEQAIEHVA